MYVYCMSVYVPPHVEFVCIVYAVYMYVLYVHNVYHGNVIFFVHTKSKGGAII